MIKPPVKVKLLNEDSIPPLRATEMAGGFDLHATMSCVLAPGAAMLMPAGVAMEIPKGWQGQVWPRSGLAVRHQVDRLAGLIDADYRGEVKISLINHGDLPVEIRKGDRIAQITFVPHLEDIEIVDELTPTDRQGGFGSTGV